MGDLGRTASYLRSNIGVCLWRLGLYVEAEAAHRDALAAYLTVPTRDACTEASIRERIGTTLISQDKLSEARIELEATWELLQGAGQSAALMATSVRNSLARLDLHDGDYARALDGFLLARDEYRARGGTPGNLLAVTTNIAQSYTSLMRHDEALTELEFARELCAELEPEPGRHTHSVLLSLARAHLVAGDFAAAKPPAEEALVLGARLVGTLHPTEPINRLILARAEHGLGNLDGALQILVEGEEAVVRVYGRTSRELLRLRRHRIDTLARAGRAEEGSRLAREALDGLGPDAPEAERAHWRAALEEVGATFLP
jgi:tetratricopeptide (TPR) repeat protein